MTVTDDQIRTLIHTSCLCLDDGDWDGYLGLCSDKFTYRITTYSAELRRDMIWLEQDRAGMADLFSNLENHVTLQGRFLHQPSVAATEHKGDGAVRVVTTFLLVYTDLEGVTNLFAAGRYNDVIDVSGDSPLLKERDVRLDTRDLGGGTHFPI